MVEIFKDISADNELFAHFSLITAASCRSTRSWWRAAGAGARSPQLPAADRTG